MAPSPDPQPGSQALPGQLSSLKPGQARSTAQTLSPSAPLHTAWAAGSPCHPGLPAWMAPLPGPFPWDLIHSPAPPPHPRLLSLLLASPQLWNTISTRPHVAAAGPQPLPPSSFPIQALEKSCTQSPLPPPGAQMSPQVTTDPCCSTPWNSSNSLASPSWKFCSGRPWPPHCCLPPACLWITSAGENLAWALWSPWTAHNRAPGS